MIIILKVFHTQKYQRCKIGVLNLLHLFYQANALSWAHYLTYDVDIPNCNRYITLYYLFYLGRCLIITLHKLHKLLSCVLLPQGLPTSFVRWKFGSKLSTGRCGRMRRPRDAHIQTCLTFIY